MGLPSMTPLLGILDDCDQPEAGMLVVIWGHPDHPTVEYVNPRVRPLALRGRLRAFPSRFISLDRFGRAARFDLDGTLRIVPGGRLTATYPDGCPRPWQGPKIDTTRVRSQVAGPVMKAVRVKIAGAVEAR